MTNNIWVIQILGGAIFALSGFVIYRYIQVRKQHSGHTFPLHIWLLSASYNMLVLSLMLRVPKNDIAFVFSSTALCLGIYSLWVLSRYQNRPR